MVFINLYWKDAYGRSAKTVEFCKHKSSSLYNEAVEAKKRGVTPDVALTDPVRKYLLKVI